MKKILPILLSLFSFVACDNVSNNNAEFVPIDTEAVTTECTTTVEDPSTIVLSDGTWSITQIQKHTRYKTSTESIYTVVAEQGSYTFTYAKLTQTMDCTNMSDEEIEEIKNETTPPGASVTWNNDNTVTLSMVATEEDLSRMGLNFSTFSGTDVKTNADNTKYVVDNPSGDSWTYKMYLAKTKINLS